MKKTYVTDMTVGKPLGLLVSFMLPLLIGNIFQQLYNMVDSIIVGQYVGADALAAVGATGSLNFLIFSLCGGMANGTGVVISQHQRGLYHAVLCGPDGRHWRHFCKKDSDLFKYTG